MLSQPSILKWAAQPACRELQQHIDQLIPHDPWRPLGTQPQVPELQGLSIASHRRGWLTDGRGGCSHFASLVCRRFKALQQHIDELTREKFDLIRGLQTQRKVQESLEAESERFTNDFNRQVSLSCCQALHHPLSSCTITLSGGLGIQ